MKKSLVLLIALLLVSNISNAQSFREKYNIYFEASAGTPKSHDIALSFRGILNYKKSDNLYVGGGIGIFYINNSIRNYESSITYSDYSLEMPIIFNIKGNFKNTDSFTPYYSLSAGYIFPLKKAISEYSIQSSSYAYGHDVVRIYNYNNGLFIAPELGLTFGNISYGIEFMYGMNYCSDIKIDTYFYNKCYSSYKYDETTNYIISFKVNCLL